MIYFAPEVAEELGALGVRPRDQYFAQRAAPMGAVGPGLVAATFFNFNPAMVARTVPSVWATASPGDVVNARLRAVDGALRRLLGEELLASPAVAESATLARRACEGATPEDRPLYAGHADLPWPDEPHLMLWHAVTLLREHRGDAHLHALVSAGLSGIEALVTHTATGTGFTIAFAQQSRGWSPEQWADAKARLAERGLLDGDALTPAGQELRREVEEHTTRMSVGPWRRLGADGIARLTEVSKPLSKAVLPAFAIEGVFAPRPARS
ncbi:hypothetical protein WCD41_12385 [Actinomycetospora sp. OC33-EN06]|uniref:SalK n=2 Tax=Actinomycetospora aeridis TaxID=3129231 RepID=A0ABU8N4E8_9PSEU